MEYRRLGQTDLQVSVICLGSMTWGEQNSEAEGHAQLDYACAHGVNFIDTAEIYAVPTRAETYGASERIIGSWLSARRNRDQVVIASKIVPRNKRFPYIREGLKHTCLDATNIAHAVEDSLRRLQTDYIDLYQLHWPERVTNYFGQLGYPTSKAVSDDGTPFEETLAALETQVKAGKIRHVGLSNETPWGVMRYLRLAEQKSGPRIQSVQNPYNLLNRSYEIGLAEISIREQCGLLAYSPIGGGTLSGKYLGNSNPPNARLTLFGSEFSRYSGTNATIPIERYVTLARAHGLDPAQMALAYVNTRPFLTATIIGATNLNQLKVNISSIDLKLSHQVLQGIEAIHNDFPIPCP